MKPARTAQTDGDRVALTVEDAAALGESVARRAGYGAQESRIIAANLLDAELCGYPALGIARLLSIAEDPRNREQRKPVTALRETAASALLDGGNNIGLYAVHRAAEITIEKARASGFALVGMHNSFFSGRSGRYAEMVARAGFVCLHLNSTDPCVAAHGGKAPVLGTNPVSFALPGDPDPVVFDMGTSAITRGEVVLAARLGQPLPENVAVGSDGRVTRDAAAALAGAILPFAGHKGFGLSLMVQALGLLGGAALPRGNVQDFGFLFVAFDPGLLMPPAEFTQQAAELIRAVKATPRQPGVAEIRIPSERAFRERRRRQREGVVVARAVYDKLRALES